MGLVIAYLAQGRIRITSGSDIPRTLDSPYDRSLYDRSVRSQQRHAWKHNGDGFLFGQVLWSCSNHR